MSPEILLVRHGNGYRVLHGYLHLANEMSRSSQTVAVASGEGEVNVTKTPSGILIGDEQNRLPLVKTVF